MRILLTGYKGFIGSNLYRAFPSNYEIVGYDWKEELPEVSNFDWVIHLGAISSTTETNVEKIMEQNYDFSVNLFEECVFAGVNMQYASSASVYGLRTDFREDAPVDPRTPYAWSKYLFERYAAKYKPKGVTVQGFRYFNVYGPGEEHKGSQASPFTKFEIQKQKDGYITLFEQSDKYKRDFIHVNNVVDYHLRFLKIGESGVWNIGSGRTMSFRDVANLVGGDAGEKREIPIPDNIRPYYQEYTCADMTKTRKTLADNE